MQPLFGAWRDRYDVDSFECSSGLLERLVALEFAGIFSFDSSAIDDDSAVDGDAISFDAYRFTNYCS